MRKRSERRFFRELFGASVLSRASSPSSKTKRSPTSSSGLANFLHKYPQGFSRSRLTPTTWRRIDRFWRNALDNLQLLYMSPRSSFSGSNKIGIDLFDLRGDLHLYEVDRDAVHRLCEITDHNLFRLQSETQQPMGIGLVCDWPFHWRAGKLTLQEVEPDDHVAIYSRATLSGILPHECRPVDAWIHLRGPVRIVSDPITVTHFPNEQETVQVSDVFIRKGCEILSSPTQTLFEISGSRRLRSHA